jgi:hypothetical protein
MANQVLRLWERVLQVLVATAKGSAINSGDLFTKIAGLPEQPKTVWKRLVLDMQVRHTY